MDDIVSKEIMKNPPSTTHVLTVSGKSSVKLDTVIDVMRFSKLNLLLRVTARVFHFVTILKHWATNNKQSISNRELSPEELNNAEFHWLRHVQSHLFKCEYQYLQGNFTGAAPICV